VVVLQLASPLDGEGEHLGEGGAAEGEVLAADGQILTQGGGTLTAAIQAALKSWALKRS
jgi:hypothetical protein